MGRPSDLHESCHTLRYGLVCNLAEVLEGGLPLDDHNCHVTSALLLDRNLLLHYELNEGGAVVARRNCRPIIVSEILRPQTRDHMEDEDKPSTVQEVTIELITGQQRRDI